MTTTDRLEALERDAYVLRLYWSGVPIPQKERITLPVEDRSAPEVIIALLDNQDWLIAELEEAREALEKAVLLLSLANPAEEGHRIVNTQNVAGGNSGTAPKAGSIDAAPPATQRANWDQSDGVPLEDNRAIVEHKNSFDGVCECSVPASIAVMYLASTTRGPSDG